MKRALTRALNEDGRILIVAMDHTNFLDKAPEGLVEYERTVRACVAAGADAFLSPLGSIKQLGDAYGRTAVFASVRAGGGFGPIAVERALALGADGIKCVIFPFVDDTSVADSHQLAARADQLGLPFLSEPIPGGFSAHDMRSPEILAAGARMATEHGADMVKTFYTGDPESMKLVVAHAGVPVVILGGHAKGELRDLYQEVYDAVVVAGCAGAAIGTNIWTAANPGAVTAGLTAILHDEADPDAAVKVTEEYAAGVPVAV